MQLEFFAFYNYVCDLSFFARAEKVSNLPLKDTVTCDVIPTSVLQLLTSK